MRARVVRQAKCSSGGVSLPNNVVNSERLAVLSMERSDARLLGVCEQRFVELRAPKLVEE